MKLTQKVNHFTVFKSSPSTTVVAAHRSSRQITKNLCWLDMQGSIRDVFIGWGEWTGGKKLQLKVVVGH